MKDVLWTLEWSTRGHRDGKELTLSRGDFGFTRDPNVNLVLIAQGRPRAAPNLAAQCRPGRIQHLRASNPERCSPWRRIRRDVWKTTTPCEYSSWKTTFPVEAPVLKTCTGTHLYLGYSCKHYGMPRWFLYATHNLNKDGIFISRTNWQIATIRDRYKMQPNKPNSKSVIVFFPFCCTFFPEKLTYR